MNKQDSLYKPIERQPKKFNKLHIPRSLQAELPFASKPKLASKRSSGKGIYASKRQVILDREGKQRFHLLQQLNTIRNDKVGKRKAKQAERRAAKTKKMEAVSEKKRASTKEKRKRKFAAEQLGRKHKYQRYGPGL